MITLLIVLGSLAFLFLIVRFIRYVFPLYVMLCAALLLSFPLMVFDPHMGSMVFAWSLAIILVLFLATLLAGAVTGVFALFVALPITAIAASVRSFFIRIK